MNLAIYRIRKTKKSRITGQIIPAPGVGLRLSKALGAEVVTSQTGAASIPDGTLVINYGRSTNPKWRNSLIKRGGYLLNKPEAVANAVNKLTTLTLLNEVGVPCLVPTNSKEVAQSWLDDGLKVIVRAVANGKMGKGVSLVSPGEELPSAPLYTQFFDKTHEFRVHVFNGQVIDYVQKKKMGSKKLEQMKIEKVDILVRNHGRGWVFARNGIYVFDEIKQLAIKATQSLGLDFAGVDILARIDKYGALVKAVVCEVNSAPGMSDKNTFNAYTTAVDSFVQSLGQKIEVEEVEPEPVVKAKAAPKLKKAPGYIE